MADSETQRRLAAILAADVAGYTRLMELDTDGTVAAWKAARNDVIEPTINDFRGNIIKFTGDGFLVEFPSVQDAVNCAIKLQKGLAKNALDFRIGINLGDIVDDGNDIHGEGVNIAARLEGLAEPGGICISGDVYNQVQNRIEATFNDMGEQEVKHVSQPVRAYSITIKSENKTSAAPVQQAEKASIAVLPFDNMSNDPEQEYFSDGIVEDIITELSKFRWLKVIARNSTFTYKGKSTDIKVVGEELGARYVVEGSVRKAGNRIRINAQLIDSSDGSHIWAERYDRELADVFDLQDEITETLVTTIEPELSAVEKERARRKPTENLDAWELYQRAVWLRFQYSRENYDEADRLLAKALELDPDFAAAYAMIGYMGYARVIMGFTDDPKEALSTAYRSSKKAITLDDRDASGFFALGNVETLMGQYDTALKNFDHAIELNPNYAQAYITRGLSLLLSGSRDSAEIRKFSETGMRFSPKDPLTWSALNTIGSDQALEGELEAAVTTYQASCQQPITTYFPFLHLAAILYLLDRKEEAQTAFDKALEMKPDITLERYARQVGPHIMSQWEGIGAIEAFKELGLPDE